MLTAESYFSEIPNIILLLFYTVFLVSYTRQRKVILLAFLLHMLLIFLTNGVLFDPYYMSDQYLYVNVIQSIRANFEISEDLSRLTSNSAGIIYSTVPLICNSVFSVAGMSYFFYMLIFLFMYKKNILNSHGTYFFFLYPSLALYAAVGLRDTLILFIMIVSIYYLINNRYIIAMIFGLFLLALKIQNYLIFLFSMLLWIIMDKGVNFRKIGFVILSILVLVALSDYVSIEKLNFYRLAFALEDGFDADDIDYIKGGGDLMLKGFLAIFKFLLMPLPWAVRNVLQFVQSLENIGILVLLFFAVRAYFKLGVKDKVIRFLFAHTLIAFSVYGLVISNYGTAARYRYPYITVFFLFFYHRMNQLYNRQLLQPKDTLHG